MSFKLDGTHMHDIYDAPAHVNGLDLDARSQRLGRGGKFSDELSRQLRKL